MFPYVNGQGMPSMCLPSQRKHRNTQTPEQPSHKAFNAFCVVIVIVDDADVVGNVVDNVFVIISDVGVGVAIVVVVVVGVFAVLLLLFFVVLRRLMLALSEGVSSDRGGGISWDA